MSLADDLERHIALRNAFAEAMASPESTPSEPEREADPERFRLYRLCACGECGGTGKVWFGPVTVGSGNVGARGQKRCTVCRGEGRSLDLVATCGSPEAVGVALVTLGREGEWKECPVGVLDTGGAKNEKWIVSPWLPSARNVSDAGRLLAKTRHSS